MLLYLFMILICQSNSPCPRITQSKVLGTQSKNYWPLQHTYLGTNTCGPHTPPPLEGSIFPQQLLHLNSNLQRTKCPWHTITTTRIIHVLLPKPYPSFKIWLYIYLTERSSFISYKKLSLILFAFLLELEFWHRMSLVHILSNSEEKRVGKFFFLS